MTPVELSRTVLRAVRRAVDDGELDVAVPGRTSLTPPGPGGCGDYATNVALQLARPAGQPPLRVAEILRERLVRTDGISDVVVTGPGFLNISLRGTETALVREILLSGHRYGHADRPTGRLVQLHAPHEVRAVVVMDAVARILRSQGALLRTSCAERPEPEWGHILGVHIDAYGTPDAPAPLDVNVRPVPAAPADPTPSAGTPPAGPFSTRPSTTGPASQPTTWSSARATLSSASVTPTPAPGRSPATPPTWASTPSPGTQTYGAHRQPYRKPSYRTHTTRPPCGTPSPITPASSRRPPRTTPPTAWPGISSPSPTPFSLFSPPSFLVVRRNPRPPTVPGSRSPKPPGRCWPVACPCSASTHPNTSREPVKKMSRSAHPAGPRHADVLPEGHYSAPPADLNSLDPKVWAQTVGRDEDGVVTVGGIDVKTLAEEHGTPAYVVDEADFRARARAWRGAFGTDADVFYAGKAFLSRAVVRWLHEEGLNLDVCSGGELATALSAGMPADRIAFHGNNKSTEEIRRAITEGVGRIVLDSFQEIVRVAHIAQSLGKRQRVQIRITVGVEAHTHEFIATAHEDQKFGIPLAGGQAAEAVRRALKLDGLELIGIHSHIGSQIFDMSGFEVAAHRVVGLLKAVRDEHGVELPEIDLGGGLGIAYTSDDDPSEPHEIAKALTEIVTRECEAAKLRTPRISVEPGRAIVGPTAFTLYEVGTIKPLDGLRTYVSVDGGMSDNIRTALYDAEYTVALVSRTSDAQPMLARVVGKHCESGDIVVKDAFLPADLAPGDLIAVPATGAYCRSMASNYNHVLRPPVVSVHEGESRVIVRRETEEDLLRLDVG